MSRFRLNRTEKPPVEFDGDLFASLKSPQFSRVDSPRYKYVRWFTLDVYQTAGNVLVGSIGYRFRGALPNEAEFDDVLTAASWLALVDALRAWDAWGCVDGCPDDAAFDSLRTRIREAVEADWSDLCSDAQVAMRNRFAVADVIA